MKIILIGYGKMGKAIEEVAIRRSHEVIMKIDLDNRNDLNKENIAGADVAIEFTGPDSAYANCRQCIELGIPVVSGSTGWTNRLDELKELCRKKNGGFVYSSNYSIGVNLFFELNTYLANLMTDQLQYDVSMEEIHHTQKKDAPSGTAITLAEQILGKLKRKKKWINSESKDPELLGIESKRIDPAPGTHKVRYTSEIDDIEIIHTAHSRAGFAAGAVLAAEFIRNKKGFFTMKDVLGL